MKFCPYMKFVLSILSHAALSSTLPSRPLKWISWGEISCARSYIYSFSLRSWSPAKREGAKYREKQSEECDIAVLFTSVRQTNLLFFPSLAALERKKEEKERRKRGELFHISPSPSHLGLLHCSSFSYFFSLSLTPVTNCLDLKWKRKGQKKKFMTLRVEKRRKLLR